VGDKGVVLFFFRSAAWCPFCQAQLIDLNSGVADIEKRAITSRGFPMSRRRLMRILSPNETSNIHC
jgi:peroxiredoxin